MNQKQNSAAPAGERLFRTYMNHCLVPDRDTLFALLEAAHSLSDRLTIDTGKTLLGLQEFLALKCLRNLFHHHQELRHVVRLVPKSSHPVISELLFLCLVPRDIVELAIEETGKRHRLQTREACEAVFHWYGSAVNINPAIFNFIVGVYEQLQEASVDLPGEEFLEFQDRYKSDLAEGWPVRVDGRLSTPAGNVEQVLAAIMTSPGLR